MTCRLRLLRSPRLLNRARPALAWNKPGHIISAAIACDVLAKEDPQALARIVELLKSHPQWNTFAKRLESVAEDDRDRYLFMIAARWADDVRDNKQFHRGSWHYVNFPVFVAGDEGKVTPPPSSDANAISLLAHQVGEAMAKGDPAPPPGDIGENILTALAENMRMARTGDDAGQRAVAICWLMHLVGDLHQPLHTASLFGVNRPNGDRGGNNFYIRVREDGAVINLHQFWDGLLTGTQTYRETGNLATELRLRRAFAREKLPELVQGVDGWFHDSVVLARDFAYKQGRLAGGLDRSDAPVLPERYAAEAKAIAERRVVLAGYRLAALLRNAAGKADQQRE